jgi:hypothetical protein
MVVAVAALVVASTGSAIAAKHYLITSTRQISPSVLKQLRGATGAQGALGPAGASGVGSAGKDGTNGAAGTNGTNGSNGADLLSNTPLASGQTESGVFTAGGGSSTSGFLTVPFSFPQPLAVVLDSTHEIETVNPSTTHCPGSGHADSGYLCIYRTTTSAVTPVHVYNPETALEGTSRFGAVLVYTISSGGAFVYGTWSVTAP